MRNVYTTVSGILAVWLAMISLPVPVAADDLDSIDFPAAFCDKMLAIKTPDNFGWGYFDGLVMDGMFRVYERTGKKAYYDFFKQWIDRYAADTGLAVAGYRSNLDAMHNGFALCVMYGETGENRYKTCAQKIFNALPSYRRTTDGTPVHIASGDELWLDGAWMLGHFLTNYGRTIGSKAFCDSLTGAHAISVHRRCIDPQGTLPYHAWDENGSAGWSNDGTHLSPEKWCRSIGWIVMDIADILDEIDADDPRRTELSQILTSYLTGLRDLQDSVTGLWYQVVDKPGADSNWVEQSSACMYAYAMAKCIENGLLDEEAFGTSVKRAYQGAMGNVLMNSSGYPDIYGTCVGTGIGSYSYYVNRSQPKNDPHGTGAWLIAVEYLRARYPHTPQRIYQAESATFDGVVESDYRGFGGYGYVNTTNAVGAAVEWVVTLDTAARCRLQFRYANGSGGSRTAAVSVNGDPVEGVLDCADGAWNSWDSRSVTADLKAGRNTIRLAATGSGGCPNIDLLAVDPLELSTAVRSVPLTYTNHAQTLKVVAAQRVGVPVWASGGTASVFDLSGRLVYRGSVTGTMLDLALIDKSESVFVVQFTSPAAVSGR